MGIPVYFKEITEQFPNIIVEVEKQTKQTTHLFFDFNGLIHPCVHNVLNKLQEKQEKKNKIIKITNEQLEELFLKVSSKVDLICLPECVAIFSDNVKDINLFLNKYKESFFNFIKEQAKKKNSSILVGSVPERYTESKFVNR